MFAFSATPVAPGLPLRIELPDLEPIELGPHPRVTLRVLDRNLLAEGGRPGLDELAEAYVDNRIEIEGPITDIIEVAVGLSRSLPGRVEAPRGTPAAARAAHGRDQDAGAIAYHYDLSNVFYRLWLDPEMVYSCAYFESGRETLAQAQLAKLRHVCRKLRLQPGQYLLDVGCGWGALARLAAREFGVRVLGITLSQAQLELARERVRAERLQERVQLELMDYRDLPRDGRFDRIASIGMFEHVGHANLPAYFRLLHDALRPGGLLMNHGITARHTDPDLQQRNEGAGFIRRHVFPHGEVPHLALAIAGMSDAGLEVADVENLRPHYARTLECWSRALEAHLAQARQMVPEKTLRIWRLYLAGCAWAFRVGRVQIHQVLAARPRDDGGHELPWSRADLYRQIGDHAGGVTPHMK